MAKFFSSAILLIAVPIAFELLAPDRHAAVGFIDAAAAQQMPPEMPPEDAGATKQRKPQSTKAPAPASTETPKEQRTMMPAPDVPERAPKASPPASKQEKPPARREREGDR